MITGIVKGVPNVARLLNKTLPDEAQKDLASSVKQEAQDILIALRASIPVKTGLTKAELKIQMRNKGLSAKIGLISASRGYIGRFLQFGVKPHVIKAKNGQALSFGGRIISEVHHPGFEPKRWFDIVYDAKTRFQDRLRQAITNALRKANGS